MATSQNGWPLSPRRVKRKVAGTNIVLEVVDSRAGDLLIYVAEQYHKRVEPLQAKYGCYGYAFRRNVNNPSVYSNHASATAIDLNAIRHPNGRRNTFTKAQYVQLRQILREVGGVVHNLPNDEMHFEIRGSQAVVNRIPVPKALAPAVTVFPDPPPRVDQPPTKGDKGFNVEALQATLNRYGFTEPILNVDGIYGDATAIAVGQYQRAYGHAVTGRVTARLWAGLLGDPAGLAGNYAASDSGSAVFGGSVETSSPKGSGGTARISFGDTGPNVEKLQGFLNRYAPVYSVLAVDGRFGAQTRSVVRELQRRLGVPVTGDFDVDTAARCGYRNPPFDGE